MSEATAFERMKERDRRDKIAGQFFDRWQLDELVGRRARDAGGNSWGLVLIDILLDALAEQQERADAAAMPCPPCMECGGETKLYGTFDLIEWDCKDANCGAFTMKSVPNRGPDA